LVSATRAQAFVAIAHLMRIWMKRRRFQYEATRLFGSKILCELLHTKNVVEASVFCCSGCTGTVCGSSRRLRNWMRSKYQGRRKSESASGTLAFEYIEQRLIFRSGAAFEARKSAQLRMTRS